MVNHENSEGEDLKIQKDDEKSKSHQSPVEINIQKIRAALSEASYESMKLPQMEGFQAFREAIADSQKIRASLSAASFEPIELPKVYDIQAFKEAAMDWQKIRTNLSVASFEPIKLPEIEGLSTYTNAAVTSGLFDGNFNLSQSLSEMNELSSESEDFEETNFQNYSEEHIQFILNSFE